MINSRTTVLLGTAASIIAIAVTVISSDGIRSALESNYHYPNAQGVTLADASSMALTYLFIIGGFALAVSLLYLFARPLATSKSGWWLGATFTVLGLAIAVYNSSQEFPLAVKVAYFLPSVAGALWLVLPTTGTRKAA